MARKSWLERRWEKNANVSAEDMAAMGYPSGHSGETSHKETDIRRFAAAVTEALRKTLPAKVEVPEEMLFGPWPETAAKPDDGSAKKRRGAVQAKGYSDSGASHTKRSMKGWTGVSGSPQEDIDYNNATLRQRGRLLYMSSPLAAAPINTARTKVVGSGLRMRAGIQTEFLGLSPEAAQKWNKRTEAEFRLWSEKKENCDALGINNLYQMEQLAMLQWFMTGDVFCLIQWDKPTPTNPYTLRLHLIEADRVSTPNLSGARYRIGTTATADNGNDIYDGIEVDGKGKVVAFHICNTYPEEYTAKAKKWTRVEAYGKKTGLPNVLHVRAAERCEQYRGVTILAPVIELLQQQKRFTESQLMAALIQSFLTAWIESDAPETGMPFNETGPGEYGTEEEQKEVSRDPNEYEIGPGTVNILRPGEKVVLGNPNVPTEGFDTFVKNLAMQLGAALEIPADVLLKEFDSSYSAARGALEEAWEVMKMYRSWFVSDFCQPLYEIWLAEAVAIGRVKAPGFFGDPLIRAAWSHSRWDGPSQTHLDPVKEARANEMIVSNGWKTNEQVTRESYGGDWNENMTKLAQEAKLLGELYPKAPTGGGTNQ